MKSGYFDTKEKSISLRIWSWSDPSYTKGAPHIGRASYFVPDCVENGSVYNHGVTFNTVS